jgi:hypothetical protein
MEIRNTFPSDHRPREVIRTDITLPNRVAIDRATPEPRDPRTDRVELSPVAREGDDRAADERRAQRVRDLKTAHERGELDTDERIERSAVRLLEGD